ncbi:MAG: dihydroorotate dehydrogenase electron transfer subunit, partial [Chloroflexota bacterium]
FACGPLPMYQTMAQMPELKDKHVQVSLETRMACGMGLCYGCTVKTTRGLQEVCRDGPVFNLGEVVWEELI